MEAMPAEEEGGLSEAEGALSEEALSEAEEGALSEAEEGEPTTGR